MFFMQNDTGRMNLAQLVFVTYVKARMVCRSTLFSNIAYDYNVLRQSPYQLCMSSLKKLLYAQCVLLVLQKI